MKTIHHLLVFSVLAATVATLSTPVSAGVTDDAQHFVDRYTATYKLLQYQSALAQWASNIHIVEGDTMNAYWAQVADRRFAAFTGSRDAIENARKYLAHKKELPDLLVRQLKVILYTAANNPQTVPELVARRIKAETKQNEKLFGFDFKLDGQSISTNKIDDILRDDNNLDERLAAWESSKEVGTELKDGLVNLRQLRNATVQALGYDDYFQYQVSDYGMTTDDLVSLMDKFVRETRPLYRELHTWVRYELARRYGVKEVPDLIPAHWLPNRWGQDWTGLVHVKGLDLDAKLKEKSPEWFPKQAERFYMSLGFPKLPDSFWMLSDLYPPPEGATYKKNNHASAWHMDLDHDVRSLMSIEPNAEWYETVHHEFGHIYYYLSYTNPNVPILLRSGANRAFHEAIGSMMGLAAMQKPFLEHIGMFPEGQQTDEIQKLLRDAFNYIVFIPWSAGVMTHFERDLYAEPLPANQFNARWWKYKEEYQGIAPPSPRGEEYCDAASKTHINNDAAQYYDYAISYVLLMQIHNHIATKILHENPRATDYYGRKDVGKFLYTMLSQGATRDWRDLTRESLGEDLSADSMLEYFEPLMKWLKKQNRERKATLPKI